MSDTHTVRAFLESGHHSWAVEVATFASRTLLGRHPPETDEAGRMEARERLVLMGKAGLYAPIGNRDLRGACLTREPLASASPLASRNVSVGVTGNLLVYLFIIYYLSNIYYLLCNE